jgi:GcrA cell cycle regulator
MSKWNNPALVALLTNAWAEGKSGSEIASLILEKFGVSTTRNAVIAKLDRLGKLGGRGNGGGRTNASRKQKSAQRLKALRTAATNAEADGRLHARKTFAGMATSVEKKSQGWFSMQSQPKPVEPYVERQPRAFDQAKMVSFDDLENHHCRWPVGDPRTDAFRFCGETKVIGLPYCAHCAEHAYVNARPSNLPVQRDFKIVAPGDTKKQETAVSGAHERDLEDA